MRKSLQAIGLGALVAVSLGAYAVDSFEVQPESRAYLNFNFGGAPETKQEWHYGLQFGQRAQYSREGDVLRPANSLNVDYSNVGNGLLVNGKPLRQRSYRLNQAEGEAAAAVAAEEPGFFGSIGNWFGDLFGGGEEEAAPVAEGEAAATEPGFFDSYTFADYALLGVGVLGVGYAIVEVTKSEDSEDPAAASTDGGTDGGNSPLGCVIELDPGCIPLYSGRSGTAKTDVRRDANYAEWLDGGTGQMGDLVAQ
ncbi:MAG: hypothetical protein AABY95_07280 [Pseudomonadota bacterium]